MSKINQSIVLAYNCLMQNAFLFPENKVFALYCFYKILLFHRSYTNNCFLISFLFLIAYQPSYFI